MARFDLFRFPGDQGYVVDVQSNHASDQFRTRVVVPLLPLVSMSRAFTRQGDGGSHDVKPR